MATEQPIRPITSDERLYLGARVVLLGLLLMLYLVGIDYPGGRVEAWMYLFLLTVLGVTTALLYVWARQGADAVARGMMWVLAPDLFAVAGFTYLFSTHGDAFYPVAVLLAISYALVVTRQQLVLVGLATAVAYLFGHAFGVRDDWQAYLLIALKAAAIPLIASMVAVSVERQRHREKQALSAIEQSERLNERLNRRIAELQAVSQITEIVHSSLDFERVGPVVLEILGKVIGVASCCLFVIGKEHSETLFSASIGSSAPVTPPTGFDYTSTIDDHFACMAVYDHSDIMVLFCTSGAEMEQLSEEDRLVLGAVASELVVAVENSRLYKLTKKLAVTDELTELANYRYLQQRLDEEFERARRYDKRLTLLMIDVDDFKRFNDSHGHIAGDRALSDIGAVLSSAVREVDLVARYGGEEFSIVLPETDSAGAFIAAEKVREKVAQHLFVDADGDACCSLTVSIGLATFPTHATDKESLLREADDALYNAKHGGKNRVRAPQPRAAQPITPDETNADEWTGA